MLPGARILGFIKPWLFLFSTRNMDLESHDRTKKNKMRASVNENAMNVEKDPPSAPPRWFHPLHELAPPLCRHTSWPMLALLRGLIPTFAVWKQPRTWSSPGGWGWRGGFTAIFLVFLFNIELYIIQLSIFSVVNSNVWHNIILWFIAPLVTTPSLSGMRFAGDSVKRY